MAILTMITTVTDPVFRVPEGASCEAQCIPGCESAPPTIPGPGPGDSAKCDDESTTQFLVYSPFPPVFLIFSTRNLPDSASATAVQRPEPERRLAAQAVRISTGPH